MTLRRALTPDSVALGDARAHLGAVGHDSREKPHVFVAMPFAEEYADRFHYGIRGAANATGFLCERADLASFTGGRSWMGKGPYRHRRHWLWLILLRPIQTFISKLVTHGDATFKPF